MITFLVTCFFIGVSASAAVGPVFILTFNRSVIYGFWNGFATALGASLVDGFFFMLALAGALSLLTQSRNIVMIVDIIGGSVLLFLGLHSLLKPSRDLSLTILPKESLYISMSKSFLITLFNPLVALFFMGISIKFFGEMSLTLLYAFFGGVMVMLGSLTMLTSVAGVAQWFGAVISLKKLRIVSYVSGFLFIGIGTHFIIDFAIKVYELFY